MKARELRALLGTLREHGVAEFSDGPVSIRFGVRPERTVASPRPPDPPANEEEARMRQLDALSESLFRV